MRKRQAIVVIISNSVRIAASSRNYTTCKFTDRIKNDNFHILKPFFAFNVILYLTRDQARVLHIDQ